MSIKKSLLGKILGVTLMIGILAYPFSPLLAQIVELTPPAPADDPNEPQLFVEPDILEANSDPQVEGVRKGLTSSGASNAGGAIAQGAQTAASCIGTAQALRIAQEPGIKSNPAYYTKVHTTGPSENTQAGEVGVVSFDAVAYCLLNAIIEYIVKATMAFIQSGFNGGAFFANDPKQLFGNLANSVFGDFMKNLQNDPNVPQQLKGPISSGLLQAFRGGGGGSSFNQGSELSNLGGSTFGQIFGDQLTKMHGQVMEEQLRLSEQLSYGRGFLPPKEPGKQTNTVDPQGNSKTRTSNPKITTAASTLQDTVTTRANAGFNRLMSADNFNKVVTQLVQALIQILLSKLFGGQ